jgi:hypothetical protein
MTLNPLKVLYYHTLLNLYLTIFFMLRLQIFWVCKRLNTSSKETRGEANEKIGRFIDYSTSYMFCCI